LEREIGQTIPRNVRAQPSAVLHQFLDAATALKILDQLHHLVYYCSAWQILIPYAQIEAEHT
jgi:hypothetical protein